MNIRETTNLNVFQPEALLTLSQEYNKAYQENFEKTKTLEDFRNDYKVLKSQLQKLPDKISHDAMIPLGSKALAFGTIIHTNEILCLLGDNYFLECSARSAAEMVDRRIKRCDELLNERHQEGERLENWKSSITKLILETGEQDTMEIVEEVDDEKYDQLKREHRENVRRYKQALAKEKQEKSADQKKIEEEEFWARLEALELEEDMMRAEEEHAKRLQNKKTLEARSTRIQKKKVEVEDVKKKEGLPSSLSSTTTTAKKQNRVRFKEEEPSSSSSSPPSDKMLAFNLPQIPASNLSPSPVSNVPENSAFSVPTSTPSSNVPRKVSLFKQRKAMNDQ